MPRSIIILIIAATLSACRFHEPLIKFHDRSFEADGRTPGTNLKIEAYKYPRFSWLRGPNWTGAYVINSVYDENNQLKERIFTWRSNAYLSDGNLRTKTKRIYYTDSMTIDKIEYSIDKFQGRGRRGIFRKTVAWDEDKKSLVEVSPETSTKYKR